MPAIPAHRHHIRVGYGALVYLDPCCHLVVVGCGSEHILEAKSFRGQLRVDGQVGLEVRFEAVHAVDHRLDERFALQL